MVYDIEIVKMAESLSERDLNQVLSKANVLYFQSSLDPGDPSQSSLQARIRIKEEDNEKKVDNIISYLESTGNVVNMKGRWLCPNDNK